MKQCQKHTSKTREVQLPKSEDRPRKKLCTTDLKPDSKNRDQPTCRTNQTEALKLAHREFDYTYNAALGPTDDDPYGGVIVYTIYIDWSSYHHIYPDLQNNCHRTGKMCRWCLAGRAMERSVGEVCLLAGLNQ